MQLKSNLAPAVQAKIYDAIQSERINRYKAASQQTGVPHIAYYVWNCAISEAFYVSLHFSEIVCRNAIHSALQYRRKDQWPGDPTFRKILSSHYLNVLDSAKADESSQHGAKMTVHHIVSALPFGFWEHLTTKRFARYLWPKGFQKNFPNAPHNAKLEDLHDLIESVRRWRNRIAHHQAIFDKGPMRKHQEAITLIHWRCAETAQWVQAASRVSTAINARPK